MIGLSLKLSVHKVSKMFFSIAALRNGEMLQDRFGADIHTRT